MKPKYCTVPWLVSQEGQRRANELIASLETRDFKLGGSPVRCRSISRTDPRVIGAGSHSVVLGLEPIAFCSMEYHLAAKLPYEGVLDTENYVIGAANDRQDRLATYTDILREWGFDNIPFHKEVVLVHWWDMLRGDDHVSPHRYDLTVDLREGGKYVVYDLESLPFKELANGREIYQQYLDSLKLIHVKTDVGGRWGDRRYSVSGRHTNPQRVVQHIFLARVNKETSVGELVLGDLNHANFKKRGFFGRQRLTLEDYFKARQAEKERALAPLPESLQVPNPFN